MEYYRRDDDSVPKIGLGTSRLSGRECVTVTETALNLGYRLIDTAKRYGNHAEIGEALKRAAVDRDDIFLTTKVWRRNLRYEDVIAATEESLTTIGVEYIDLLLIHWPSRRVPVRETLAAMEDLKATGKVRNIGVSNFTSGQLETAYRQINGNLLSNQVLFNSFKSQDEVYEFCLEKNLLLMAYCPLAKGLIMSNEVLAEIGRRHERTPAQIALRWLVQHDNVVAIPKSTNVEHLRENLDVFDFELTEPEMRQIAQIDGGFLIRLLHRLPSLFRAVPL